MSFPIKPSGRYLFRRGPLEAAHDEIHQQAELFQPIVVTDAPIILVRVDDKEYITISIPRKHREEFASHYPDGTFTWGSGKKKDPSEKRTWRQRLRRFAGLE